MSLKEQLGYDDLLQKRHRASKAFRLICRLCTWSAMIILLVLLVSVAGRVNHAGAVSVFVDGDTPPDAKLTEVEEVLKKHPLVTGVTRDVDKSGIVSFFVDVGDLTPAEGEDRVRYADIKYELEQACFEIDGIDLTLDSSEPVVGWDWAFLSRYPSTLFPEKAGILAGIWGSIWLVLLTGLIAVPLGVGAAVYLEEYASDTWVTRLIKLNLANLAGVPSIVYGILGFAVFVRFFGREPIMIGSFQLLPFGPTLLAGACTLALLILPVIIVATQEALKSIPNSIRSASVALGATKWQTIRHQVLPAGLPGIATGVILALSRALGETAPIVVIGVLAFTRTTPGEIETPMDLVKNPGSIAEVPFDKFATLPIQIYNWVSDSRPEFAAQSARGILVLLVVLLLINSVAIFVRNRYQENLKW